ncbi:MAG: NAD-dependent epimerase/dehydratase family protein [Acidobacteriota bacterium]
MQLFLTGASGFIGRAVVAEAARRGHSFTTSPGEAQGMIHLAPVTEGIETMIAAAPAARFVLISSLAVYDFLALPDRALLNECSPIAPAGPYAQTKWAQEEVARRHATNLTILRPGIVHGPGREWFHHLGMKLSATRWLCLAPESPLPLISLENCATAIVDAIGAPAATRNLIDDNPPPRGAYVEALAARTTPRPVIHTISWPTLKRFGALGLGALHDLFNPRLLAARCKPLRYK